SPFFEGRPTEGQRCQRPSAHQSVKPEKRVHKILPTRSYSWALVINTFTNSPGLGIKSSGASLIKTQPSISGACVSILPCHSNSLSFDSPSNRTRTVSPTRALFLRREILACSFIN